MSQWTGKSIRDLHFTPSQQFVRGVLRVAKTLVDAALMLIIMSFDIGYIFAIAIAIGECMYTNFFLPRILSSCFILI
jgi:hypothetical protein